jgi:hypothetical protein
VQYFGNSKGRLRLLTGSGRYPVYNDAIFEAGEMVGLSPDNMSVKALSYVKVA